MLDATAVRANPAAAIIEIDPRAEALIDPRALRRRVQLELADVTVPPPLGQSEAALFFRVLALSGSELKIELWERGVAYGSRVVAGGADAGPLLARRVALAAAELARELSDTREDEATERADAAAQRAALERAARERTRDGPRALRPGVSAAWSPKLALAGPTLVSELHVYRKERLDLGAGAAYGVFAQGTPAEAFSLGVGPARRVVLSPRWDLDIGARAAASLLVLPDARAVDGIVGQHQTWTASVDALVRLEPRLSRGVRLALGVGGGTLLRPVPFERHDGGAARVSGPYVAAELSLVLTPF